MKTPEDRLFQFWLNCRPQDVNSTKSFFALLLGIVLLVPVLVIILLPVAIYQGIMGWWKEG